MDRRIVDTNVIARYLVQDHKEHAKDAAKLVEACDHGEITLVVLSAVLAECVFVLESFYKLPRGDIARVLSSLITSPGVEVTELAQHLDALQRFQNSKLHFVDCIIAATAVARELPIASFDSDYKKMKDVTIDLS